LGVRDLKILSNHLGVDESCTAFITELAYLASLISFDAQDRIMPSNKFDIWLMQTPADRWQVLASQWLITSRVSGLVGRAESKNVANQYVHRSLDVEGELSAPRAAPRCLQRHLALLEL